MARHTTFGIGGPAQFYAVAEGSDMLVELVRWAQRARLPYRVIGGGANLLVSDAGIRGLVVENRAAHCTLCKATGLLRAGSGATISDLALYTAKHGWAGLEWAVGLPGTVGGAIVGNAGAFGGYIGDLTRWVTVLGADGQITRLPASACGFVYRGSQFKGRGESGAVILAAEMGLHRDDVGVLEGRLKEYTAWRDERQPWGPSAGSVFKRTEQHSAGWYIEQVGLKGHRVGGAQISSKHANFILNADGATAADARALIDLAREQVRDRFGVELELEIELVGT